MANMTITSSDGRVDIVQAPEGIHAESSSDQGNQQGQGHPDEIEDVVSIGIALTTAEKLKNAKDEIELMKILGVNEEKAREITGQHYAELPGERLGKEEYMYEAVREVVIELLSGRAASEDEVVIIRTVETLLADKLREKERDPFNREQNPGTPAVEGEGGGSE